MEDEGEKEPGRDLKDRDRQQEPADTVRPLRVLDAAIGGLGPVDEGGHQDDGEQDGGDNHPTRLHNSRYR